MTNTTSPAAPTSTENVTRGALATLLAIPVAILAFAIVGLIFGGISGIAAIIVPAIAAFFYSKGAGAQLSRAGWAPFITITAIAVIIGTFVGVASGAWQAFNSVGGKDALNNPAFWRTVGNQFTINFGDNAIGILIGLGLGAVGIVSVIRARGIAATRAAGQVAAQNAPGYAQPNPYAADPAAPAVPQAPARPTPNLPSPGIILNGKPIDLDPKKK